MSTPTHCYLQRKLSECCQALVDLGPIEDHNRIQATNLNNEIELIVQKMKDAGMEVPNG